MHHPTPPPEHITDSDHPWNDPATVLRLRRRGCIIVAITLGMIGTILVWAAPAEYELVWAVGLACLVGAALATEAAVLVDVGYILLRQMTCYYAHLAEADATLLSDELRDRRHGLG